MATVLFFDGLFNITDPILHIQLYIWGWVLISILAIFAHIAWYYGRWKPYGPLQGLYWSYKDGSNAAFIFDAALIGEFVAERQAKCIFDYSTMAYDITIDVPFIGGLVNRFKNIFFYYPMAYLDDISFLKAMVYKYGHVNKDVEIARRLEGGDWPRYPSVVCGGVPVDIIVDMDNWTIPTSPQHKMVERCAMNWNEANPDDQIHSYHKFQKYLTEGKIQCDGVKKDTQISWTRINAGFTTDLESSEYTGKIIQMSEHEYNEHEMNMNKYALYLLIGGLLLDFMLLAVRLITHYVK
jgi:hypothetical protein